MSSKNLVKASAAGSGKTWGICHDALEIVQDKNFAKRVLILSYTNRGVSAIATELEKQNCGVGHSRITYMTWYSFLLSELIKPYQNGLFRVNEITTIDFSQTYGFINRAKQGTRARYITKNGNIRSNEAAELVLQLNQRNSGRVFARLEEIYPYIFIDEVQDMAGYDLEIIKALMKTNISTVCVGDNKQATFRTNNSSKNKGKAGSNVWNFFNDLVNQGLAERQDNLESRRFNQQICSFANALYPNGISMTTSMNVETGHDGIFFIEKEDVLHYYKRFSPEILRYDKKMNTENLPASNFGECKGLTFDRVLIFPNKPFLDYLWKGTALKSPEKYYVAATRPRYSLTFVVDCLPVGNKYEDCEIEVDEKTITVKHLLSEV